MNLPNDIDVVGKIYDIAEAGLEQDDCGKMNDEQCLIKVKNTMCEQQQRDTLLHETLHAIMVETGLSYDFTTDAEHLTEESVIRRLTPALLQVMRDNPEWVDSLLEE